MPTAVHSIARRAIADRGRQQPLADAHHAVERRDDADLPRERDHAERQQVQRVEDDGGERRIGERQREVGRLVGVDVVVERAGLIRALAAPPT